MSKTTSTAINNTNSHNKNTSASPPHYLMWFRRDLRLHDNTALAALCERANDNNALVSAVFFSLPNNGKPMTCHRPSLTISHVHYLF